MGLTLRLQTFLLVYLFAAEVGAAETTIEIHIDGEAIADASVNVRKGWTTESTLKTDESGRAVIDCNGCTVIADHVISGESFVSHEITPNASLALNRVELRRQVTLSGTVIVPKMCNCIYSFNNLDTGHNIGSGRGAVNGLEWPFEQVVPAGRYRIVVETSTWDQKLGRVAPSDRYLASVGVDAREESVSGIIIAAVPSPGSPRFSKTPPNGLLISGTPPAERGYSKISGLPGSVEPLVRLNVQNLQTGQVAEGASEPDGSFEVRLIAPPGSSVLVAQDRHAIDNYNDPANLPGTVIRIPIENEMLAISTGQRLNGRNQNAIGSKSEVYGGTDAGVAWLSGTLDTNSWSQGDQGKIAGELSIYSRNVDEVSLPTFSTADAYLELIIDEEGRQRAAGPENSSSDMTPSGLPIDRSEPSWREMIRVGTINFSGYEKISEGVAKGSWDLDYSVPEGTPDGIYQLVLTGQGWSMNPWVKGLDTGKLYFSDIFGEPSFHVSTIHGAARINVGKVSPPRLYSTLLMNTFSNGVRGVVAQEDIGKFGISGHLITNTARLIVPLMNDSRTATAEYNLEPFIPLTAYSNKAWLHPPKTPFKFPSGSLSMTLTYPDGSKKIIGPHPIVGSYQQKAKNDLGEDMHRNSNAPAIHLGLTTGSSDFLTSFNQYGEHEIVMSGTVEDVYGQAYDLSGTYKIDVAETLDFETGVFPSTPFEVNDVFSSAVIIQPGVPADVEIAVSLLPKSSKANEIKKTFRGRANRFGYFVSDETDFVFSEDGEYRVDYNISYTAPDGTLWMGARTWGSVVETPRSAIIAHGSRGSESNQEQRQWYLFNDTASDRNAHFFFPYQSGDVMWTENFTEWNAAMTNIVTLEDGDGSLAEIIGNRDTTNLDVDSMRLYSTSGDSGSNAIPPFVDPKNINNHWAYYYSGSGRPGVSVREFVGTDTSSNGYWRFNTPYAYQLGNGYQGDQEGDFKFLFGGAVYRAPNEDFQYYGAYGAMWAMIPASDAQGGRVMPPFQGAAGGPSGGPLFTINGEDIDLFLHPQGVRPGSILEVGDTFSFSGQVGPTLASKVAVTVTAPSGKVTSFSGNANKIGYFYRPSSNFTVEETGVYTVKVDVTHEGGTSAGVVETPFPTGGVLGAPDGQFSFYVVDAKSKTARLTGNVPSLLSDAAIVDFDLSAESAFDVATVHQTTSMPGVILEQRTMSKPSYRYDALSLNKTFPNLDIPDGEFEKRNGSDTVTVSFLIEGIDKLGNKTFEGRQVLIQGEQIINLNHKSALTGGMEIRLAKSDLKSGENLKADLFFEGRGEADIYVALVLLDGSFVTLGSPLSISAVGEVLTFANALDIERQSELAVIDLPLSSQTPEGVYKFFVVATRAGQSLADTTKWLGSSEASFSFKRE